MKRYLVETRRKKKQCLTVIKNFTINGKIALFNWGCEDGVCAGWVIFEADSKGEALLTVPAYELNTTRVMEVKRLDVYNILMLKALVVASNPKINKNTSLKNRHKCNC